MAVRWLLTVMLAVFCAPLAGATDVEADTASPRRTLELVRDWVAGYYDNSAQARADQANSALADELKHRPVFQLFVPVPVSVPRLPGHLVFQQSSSDGSHDDETIGRIGLLQFLVDPDTGVLLQRELNFRDHAAWKNAHLDPGRFGTLTPDDVQFDAGCDFRLRVNPEGTEITGDMAAGACRIFSPGLNRQLIAEDAVRITRDSYSFLGRFVDDQGTVAWGNASDELYHMRRTANVAGSGGVLVFGGTRGTGLEVVRQLMARGDSVTALVRSGSDRDELVRLGVKIVEGDALNEPDVARAMQSGRFRAVISTLGCQGCESPPDFIGNRNVSDAARAAGVDRMVLVSTIGAGDSAGAPPWIARWILKDVIVLKTRAEEHLAGSGLDYTIIRPGGLKDDAATGRGELTEDREAMGIINRADVAALIVRCLDDPATIGRTYAALDPGMQWPWDLF